MLTYVYVCESLLKITVYPPTSLTYIDHHKPNSSRAPQNFSGSEAEENLKKGLAFLGRSWSQFLILEIGI